MRSLIILVLSLCIVPVLAQDTVTLKPYTDKGFGFTSVIPDGWQDTGNGLYERAESATDVTVILQQSISASPDTIMTSLLPRLGLTQAPESIGTYQSTAFKWTLYKVDFQTATITIVVDLALTEDTTSGKTIFVSLQTSFDEYAMLHKTVFLPVLDSLTSYVEPVAAGLPFNFHRLFLSIVNIVRRLLSFL